MAKVNGTFYTAQRLRSGTTPVSPPYDGSEGQPYPVYPEFVCGVGIKLNNQVIGGVKRLIELTDILDIPLHWEYNIYHLQIEGIVDNDGEINFN